MDLEWAARMDDLNRNFQAILREHDDDGIGESARLYERIDRVFNLFSCGEGFGAAKMTGHLNTAKDVLIADQDENFSDIDRELRGWQGDAADQFSTYVHQLRDGVNLMIVRIAALQMILDAHAHLVKAMREDVCELVRKTLDGIAAAESDGWEVGMAVAGAVLASVGAAAGAVGGMPLWAVYTTIATAMTDGAAGVAVAAHEATDELGVIVNFVDSAEGLLHLVDIERLRLEKGFRELAAHLTDEHLVEVRPDRPTVVTAPDFRPGSFGLPDHVQAGHPVPTDTRDLVPEPKKRPDGPFDTSTTSDGHDRYQEQGPA